MARKKRSLEKTRQLYQQRDESGQFVGRFVFAALSAALTYWFFTSLFTALDPGQGHLSTVYRTYQYVPLALGVAGALFSGWIKERVHSRRSATFFAVVSALAMAALTAGVIFLVSRLGG